MIEGVLRLLPSDFGRFWQTARYILHTSYGTASAGNRVPVEIVNQGRRRYCSKKANQDLYAPLDTVKRYHWTLSNNSD